MSQHRKIIVSFPVVAVPAGLSEPEDMQFGAEILVRYYAGRPATMYKRNGDPGDPGEGAEVELIRINKIRDENVGNDAWRIPVIPDDLTIIHALEEWAESEDGLCAMFEAIDAEDGYLRDEAADMKRKSARESW